MSKPTIYPEWNTTEVNSIEPNTEHKEEGWLAPAGVPEKPPYQTFNFWQNLVYKWCKSNDEYIEDLMKIGPQRSQFSTNTSSSISIANGTYPHWGTTTQILQVGSAVAYTITAPGTSQFQYIYLDDSAIVTAGTNIISASEIINSTTPPVYDPTKNGFYNGLDLCIFAVKINSSGNVEPFDHRGGSVRVELNNNTITAGITPSTAWATLTMSTPSFCISGRVFAIVSSADREVTLKWRALSSGCTDGWAVGSADTTYPLVIEIPIITDFFQRFQVAFDVTTVPSQVAIAQVSWDFPVGM